MAGDERHGIPASRVLGLGFVNGERRNGNALAPVYGPIPPAGQWTRLEAPASLVAMEGRVAKGGSFYLYDGKCNFDQARKYPNVQTAQSSITIPPLTILGDAVRISTEGHRRGATGKDPRSRGAI